MKKKSKLNSKHVDLSFIEWTKDKLFIDFKKKTAILQIFYRDTDKDNNPSFKQII